ncbi:hypothetical protein VNI00_019237 [Paramarasmius palmivorus]|uniref:Uncharacterized protein n=1 Tax=Paramarasmius palmivorus TaxID=297713 RepID=A0AAW0APZ5_9AGAR
MSNNPSNFASTLANGIQDVAALLPLLGTDQCERHAGEALLKGYLYAAILPVSIFGSLGLVKAAFAVWLASITYPFFGGRWLDDAGFSTPGSVSSMVTISKGTGRYGVEDAVERLLKEQNISDVQLVKEFRISDGRGARTGGESNTRSWTEIVSLIPWNTMLIISSFLSAILSIAPYLYLMSDSWNQPLSWVFPLLRSFGSFLCVVAIQLALQLRIHRLANLSLQWQKIRQKYRFEDIMTSTEQPVLEQRICDRLNLQPNSPLKVLRRLRLLPKPCFSFPSRSTERPNDPENAGQVIELSPRPETVRAAQEQTGSTGKEEHSLQLTDVERTSLEGLLAPNWTLMLYQLALAIGMGMIVTGYVGCFSLVSQTPVENAPYVWFGLETALSLLRILVWGSNPNWDDGTGLSMSLELRKMPKPDDSEDDYLLITSPHDSYDHRIVSDYHGYISSPQPFIAHSEESFLGMVTPWVGPLQPLGSDAVTLFYSILPQRDSKSLYTTVYFADLRPTLTFSVNNLQSIFSSSFETNPITRAVQVTISEQVLKNVDSFVDSPLYGRIVDHCWHLSMCLFCRQQVDNLAVKWNVLSLTLPESAPGHSTNLVPVQSLSKYDKRYQALRMPWKHKSSYCQAREATLEHLASDTEYCRNAVTDDLPASFFHEILFLVESVILEVQLWHEEAEFAAKNLFPRQILPECIRSMISRMSAEHSRAVGRYGRYEWTSWITKHMTRMSDSLQQLLLQLRESQSLQAHACNIRCHISETLMIANLNTVKELGHHLKELAPQLMRTPQHMLRAMLGQALGQALGQPWLEEIANIAAKTPMMDSIPTPEQKLSMLFYLWIIRLKGTLSTDSGQWDRFDVLDTTSWPPYPHFVSNYTLEAIIAFPGCYNALELDKNTVSLLGTIGGAGGTENSDNPRRESSDPSGGGINKAEEKAMSTSARDETLRKILNSDTLTTLIFNKESANYLNNETRVAINNCVESATNIICLAGMRCHHRGLEDCKEQHCQSVLTNRQAWRMKVWGQPSFVYRVGFEGRGQEHVQAKGDHIQFYDTGRCFALFYCPGPGVLKITFDVHRKSQPFEIKATLVSDVDGGKGCELVNKFPVQQKKEELELEHVTLSFSKVPLGTGSICIGTDATYYLPCMIQGLVKMELVPETNNDENAMEKKDVAETGDNWSPDDLDEVTGQMQTKHEEAID